MKRAKSTKKALGISLVAILSYIGISSLLHYVLFPVPGPDASDLPRRGVEVINKTISSRFVYRQTFVETEGRFFELDNYVQPGGGPIAVPHVHPHMRERFKVVDGEITFLVDGSEQVVRAGSDIVVEPGSVHAFHNASDDPAYMIASLEAADDRNWEELADRGALPDTMFVVARRAFDRGNSPPLWAVASMSRYKQVYFPGLPVWVQDTVAFLVAPTARLFGVQAYYPPSESDD
jgi:uncharacterized cupin superfamily protein